MTIADNCQWDSVLDPKWHDSKWAQSRMDTIPNGHDPEWTQSRMDTNLNEYCALTSI